MTNIEELEKSAREAAAAGIAMLKKSQMAFDFTPAPHHVAYTRINRSGAVSQIKAKGTPKQAHTQSKTKKQDVEVSRSNVTVTEFFAAAKAACAKKGMYFNIDRDEFENPTRPSNDSYVVRDGIKHARYGDGEPTREYDGADAPAKAETSRNKPYDVQSYVHNHDGSVYNEICEFTFDSDKKGSGYYYQLNKDADEAPAKYHATPTIEKMAAEISKNNLDYNEFETEDGTCDACGKERPVRTVHAADNAGCTLYGQACDDCIDEAHRQAPIDGHSVATPSGKQEETTMETGTKYKGYTLKRTDMRDLGFQSYWSIGEKDAKGKDSYPTMKAAKAYIDTIKPEEKLTLPKNRYANTVEGWKTYIKDELSRSSSTAEEKRTGDYNKHIIYDLDETYRNKPAMAAINELLKTGDYEDHYTQQTGLDTTTVEMWATDKGQMNRLQEAIRKEEQDGNRKLGSSAYSAFMAAYDNAHASMSENGRSWKEDVYGTADANPTYHSIAYASIGGSLDNDPELREWFKKQGYSY